MASLPISEVTRLPKLKIRQEMPPDAFMEPKDAAALFEKGTRQVLVLDCGWLTAIEPDPRGELLAQIRRFLGRLPPEDQAECGFFMDQVCLPQLDAEGNRSDADTKVLQRGLAVMCSLYASVTGTAVVQSKSVPTRYPEFDGCLEVRFKGGQQQQAQLQSELEALVPDGKIDHLKVGNGRATVKFETHEQAEAALSAHAQVRATKPASKRTLLEAAALFPTYNSRPFEERGWCCLTEGLSQVVAAHLARQGVDMIDKHKAAEEKRPKLIEIDDNGVATPYQTVLEPKELQEELVKRLKDEARTKFRFDTDRVTVVQQAEDYIWIFNKSLSDAPVQSSFLPFQRGRLPSGRTFPHVR